MNRKSRTASHSDKRQTIPEQMQRIADGRHHDPFSVLGRHHDGRHDLITVFNPHAESVVITGPDQTMRRIEGSDFFQLTIEHCTEPTPVRLRWQDKFGNTHESVDPYCLQPQISDFDIHLFNQGKHWHIYKILGAHHRTNDGVTGTLFATWAPNAERVSVVGDFNHWDGRCHAMRNRGTNGVWEIFIPGVSPGALYKFEIRSRHHGRVQLKSDPYGQTFQVRPDTASIVTTDKTYIWQDQAWLDQRGKRDWLHQPMSIYEVHLGSWRRGPNGKFLGYRELAKSLGHYVKDLGFTHIELLPISEHPLDASWGYQTTGYYAPTSRHGSRDDFRYFVDYLHREGIGILLDWVPAHFPKDQHGLAEYDGTALYEHEDPRRGEHRDWGTHIYNYGRNEVKNFLIANALFWLADYHIDGLRVDAVASMLYLDYSREPDDWVPNQFGGNENLEAIEFLKDLNAATHEQHPGTLIIAEESTAWPQVTRPTWTGGLGFSMKWNMGWMHDYLGYMSHDPIHRRHHHGQLTFGLLYAFTENFVLPFSHDEVVHGKRSLLNKMPGDEWQRFANLRLLYTFMLTYPGKKLLFMGCEFGQGDEWNFDSELDWHLLEYPYHQGIKSLVRDLNQLYCSASPLYRFEFENQGFEWIDCHDASQSVLSYQRKDGADRLIVVLNFTPVPRNHYRVGVPQAGSYHEVFNSDAIQYGGADIGNTCVESESIAWMGQPNSIELVLPPLAGIVLAQIDTQPA